jgi:hypothetical protein
LLKKFQAEKNLPRLDTVTGKEILSQFTDPKLIADLSKDKLEEQLNITNYINWLVETYLTFSLNELNTITEQDFTNNLKRFQPEVILLSNFNIEYFAAISPYVNQFYEELPDSEKRALTLLSVNAIQSEMLKYYAGGLMWMNLPDCLTDQSKLKIVTMLAKSAENYAKYIPESEKTKIIENAENLMIKQHQFKSQLSHIIEVMKKNQCETLCQITPRNENNIYIN